MRRLAWIAALATVALPLCAQTADERTPKQLATALARARGPIANGINACASIQSTPNSTPRMRVPRWWRPTQMSRRAGERVSGSPGSATGS